MDDARAGETGVRSMTDSVAESAAAPSPGLSPLILACLAATWIIWGSTYLAIKWALISLPPFFQMGTRFLVAGGLLMAWMRLVRKASWPTRAQWRNAFFVGKLMLGGGMGSTEDGEQSVDSWLAVAFIAVVPIMIAAINMVWKVYPAKLEATGIAVGLAGVLMLTQGAGFRASPVGLAAIAVACLSWSAGSVLSQRRWRLAPGATGFASEMLCGGCALMLMSPPSGAPPALASHRPVHPKAGRARRRGAGRSLAGEAGAADRRVSSRRQRRRGRAARRAAALPELGAAGGDRQPQRGLGQYRNRARGAREARRLHALDPHDSVRRERSSLHPAALRSARRFRAGLPFVLLALGAGGAPFGARAFGGRAAAAREIETRSAELLGGGRRHQPAYRGRIVQHAGERGHRGDPVQGRPPGAGRRAGRGDRHHLSEHLGGGSPPACREAARARRDRRQARRGIARGSHDRGIRSARIRIRHLARRPPPPGTPPRNRPPPE